MPEKAVETGHLEVEEIIAAEYTYIAQTAFQAQEDRARVTSFYIVSLASLFGAFFSTSFKEDASALLYFSFAGLFFFLSYFGFITLKQLVLLRKAWFESAHAMNQIKDFIITKNTELNKVFRWQTKTLPDLYKPKSVAFLLAKQVALLGAITSGATAFYAGKGGEAFLSENLRVETYANSSYILILVAIIIGYVFYQYQMNTYRKELEA